MCKRFNHYFKKVPIDFTKTKSQCKLKTDKKEKKNFFVGGTSNF